MGWARRSPCGSKQDRPGPQEHVTRGCQSLLHAGPGAAGAEIVHELTEEPWGVRRFFVRDPDGHVINVLAHE
ncbi:VOC family protein [Micromonospora sp. NPDC005189]|uniref:VOC family protein n=1 Tax=unclassified Micromonospora TaxID=2617518 RepID=UPI0033B79C37